MGDNDTGEDIVAVPLKVLLEPLRKYRDVLQVGTEKGYFPEFWLELLNSATKESKREEEQESARIAT